MSKFFLKSFNFIFYIAFVYSSGFIVKYAFAPYNIWPLAIVSPVVLLYIWDKYDHRKLLSSFVYGLGYFTAGSWVFYSFSEHSDISFTISIIVTLIIVAALSLGFIIVHVLTNKIKSPESFRILCLFPASWVLMEYFRTISELSYPWLFISYSQTSSPIIYTSVFIGTYGTSFLIILFAGSIYLFLKKENLALQSYFCS